MGKRRKDEPLRSGPAPRFSRPEVLRSFGPMLSLLSVLTVIVVVYSPVLGGKLLLWDDSINITANPHLHPPTWDSIAFFWTSPYAGLYVPMTYSFLAAETALADLLGGQSGPGAVGPIVYHAGNLILHILNVSLAYSIGRRVTKSDWGGVLTGLWFGLHPLQVEPVAWVTETKALLSGFFSLSSLSFFLDATKSRQDRSPKTWHVGRYLVATAAMFLALLAKPTAVAVVPMAGLCAYWANTTSPRRLAYLLVPWLGIAVAFSVLTATLQPTAVDLSPLWARPLIAGDALSFYLAKLIFPYPLTFDYGRTPATALSHWFANVAWVVPLLIVLFCCSAPSRRVWLIPFAIFVAGLLPSLGLVPFTFQNFSTVADRYAYLAMLGPALACGYWFSSPRGKPAKVAVLAVFSAFAVLSHQQAKVWHDDISLNEHGLAVNPRSRAGHNNLAAALLQRGQAALSLEHYQAVYELAVEDGARSEALLGMGNALQQTGNLDGAQAKLEEALRRSPRYHAARLALGNVQLRKGQTELARNSFEEVLRHQPDLVEGHYNLALTLETMGRPKEAQVALRKALAVQPGHAPTHAALGNLAYRAGDYAGATQHFSASLRLDPTQAGIHFNLASALVRIGDRAAAEAHFREALRLDPAMNNARQNLQILRNQQRSP